MAGIGFKMQKLFKEDYFSSRIRAYGFAGLVTAGPWIIVVVSIALIQSLIRWTGLPDDTRELFFISISYCFIFSQVIYGTQQLIVTRYLADLFYVKKTEDVYPAFLGTSKVVVVMACMMWGVFALYAHVPALYKLLLLILFVAINVIWILFTFLTAAKYYQPVAYAFLAGGITAVITVLVLVLKIEMSELSTYWSAFLLVGSFTIGMLVTLFILYFSLLISFPRRGTERQFSYFQYYDSYPSLFWIGFLYNVGIWVCNWVIWFGEGYSLLEQSFRYHRMYDTAIFWSYLTIIPTMILFVVSIETRFYERYRTFYGYINGGGSLNQIMKAKRAMQVVLRQEIEKLIRNQGVISIIILVGTLYFGKDLGLTSDFLNIFRITVIGAFSNAMVLVISLLLLYFEDRKGALYMTVLFFSLNAVLSLLLLPLGNEGYGLSFAIGSSIAFGYGTWRLITYVSDIDFYAFTGQGVRQTKVKQRAGKFGEWLNKLNI